MVAVGAIIENTQTNKILLIKRSESLDFRAGIWEYPIGRMKQFEELDAALHRELDEEIGLREFRVVKPVSVFHFYRGERSQKNEVVGIVYWVQTDSETITLSDEHDEYKWITIEELSTFSLEKWIRRDFEFYVNKATIG